MFLFRLIFGLGSAWAGAELIQQLSGCSTYAWCCAYACIGCGYAYVDTLVTRVR